MWNLKQNLESSGHQEKHKSHTSVGRKFAPVEGLSHDLVCTGSIYHVHFAWQVWHGQLSPRFKFNKLKSFSGVEIDQNHVDKRILGGKGFAVGRLKRHNFCPASASVGRKFAPVEGLSHDLVCTGSIYRVHFAWQVWHGQLSPRFKFNKLKSFSGVEIDQNHVDKRILGGKGFAVGRLKRHNFCPASALRNRCCINTKRCSGGYTSPQVLRLRWH